MIADLRDTTEKTPKELEASTDRHARTFRSGPVKSAECRDVCPVLAMTM